MSERLNMRIGPMQRTIYVLLAIGLGAAAWRIPGLSLGVVAVLGILASFLTMAALAGLCIVTGLMRKLYRY